MQSQKSKKRARFPSFREMLATARYRRDERGVAAVEFAIIAPVFFFLMFVIAETAMVFIAEQVMDNAVFETARLIRTGQVQDGWNDAQFETAVCTRMSVFVNCDADGRFYLEVKSYDSFEDLELAQPLDENDDFEEPGGFDFGGPSSIVVVRAYYQWPTNPIYGGMSLASMEEKNALLIGSFAAFRNEPYTEE